MTFQRTKESAHEVSPENNVVNWHGSVVRAVNKGSHQVVITSRDRATGKTSWRREVDLYSKQHGFGYDLQPPELIALDDCLLMDCYGVHYKDGGWGAFSLSRLSDGGSLGWTKRWDVLRESLRRLPRGLLLLHFPKSRFRGVENPLLEAQLLDPENGRSRDSCLVNIPEHLSMLINRYGSLSAVEVSLNQDADPPKVLVTLNDVPGAEPRPIEQRTFETPLPFAKP